MQYFILSMIHLSLLFWACPVGQIPEAGKSRVKGHIIQIKKGNGIKVDIQGTWVEVKGTGNRTEVGEDGKFSLENIQGPDLNLIFIYADDRKAFFSLNKVGYGRTIEIAQIDIRGIKVKCTVKHYPTSEAVGNWLNEFDY